jgi:C4-dicarboxylate-specific signal transduction histidine kinase
MEQTAAEIRRLQGCINDLISVLALPAMWGGQETAQIVSTLLDVLVGTLRLDFAYVRLKDPAGDAPIEMVRLAESRNPSATPQEIGQVLSHWLADDPRKRPPLVRNPLGDGDVAIVPLRLGLQDEIGVIVAGSQRSDFPAQTERLLLSVAANQAAIGLQEARLRSEQKRVARELDLRVAQRTQELAAANDELKKEIAERKRAEEKLRQDDARLKRSEAFLAEAQRLSSTGSFSWQVEIDHHTWSEQMYRIFEIDPATPVTFELVAGPIHPEDRPTCLEQVETAQRAGRDFEVEFRLQMPDLSLKYVHVVAHATWDQEGQLEYIGAVQDETERRHSEDALEKVRSELAHVARVTTLGALTASIAHEVNQPLSGIVTNASTCLRMLAADPPNVEGARETTKRALRDGNRAADVIKRLRALFGNKGTATEPVDLNEATREVLALLSNELHRGGVVVRAELAEELPTLTGDRVQLQQVILNLLLNGSEAMSGVGDRPRQLVIRTDRDEGESVRLRVQDAGVGFDPSNLERLFDAFYTTKADGMGIGLSVSRSIIESHRGRLWAEPNDGPGATFSFLLPSAASRVATTQDLGLDETSAFTALAHGVRNS